MPRRPSIRFGKRDGMYFTTVRGQQIRLSSDKAEAEKAFHALMLEDRPAPARKRPPFRDLTDAFLEESHAADSPETFAIHRCYLQSFFDHVKGRRTRDLMGETVTRWLKANPSWGQSTRSLAVQQTIGDNVVR